MIGLPAGEQLTNGRFEQLVEQADQGVMFAWPNRLSWLSTLHFAARVSRTFFAGGERAGVDTAVALA